MRLKDRQSRTPTVLAEKHASLLRVTEGFFGDPSSPGVTKVAVTGYSEVSPSSESDKDSRKRRLAELLKKREHSGTATGSAEPIPPRGQ